MYELTVNIAMLLSISKLVILIDILQVLLFFIVIASMLISWFLMVVYIVLSNLKVTAKYKVLGNFTASIMIIVKVLYVWTIFELIVKTMTSFIFRKKRINLFFEYSKNGKIHQSLNFKTYEFLRTIKPAYTRDGRGLIVRKMMNNNWTSLINDNPSLNMEVYTNDSIVRIFTKRIPEIRFIPNGVPQLRYQINERISLIPYNVFMKSLFNKKERNSLFRYITEKVVVNKYTIEIVNN